MIQKLDASHECALNHWAVIAQMKECCTQAERHLKDTSRKVLNALHGSHQSDFEPDEAIEKDCWFQFYPHTVRRWNHTNTPLITLGLENIDVERVLHLTSEPTCTAYVYSPYRADKAMTDNTNQLAAITPPPPGFAPTFDSPDRGYIFQKVLPALSASDFCDQARLEHYLTDSILTLMQWYKASEPAILSVLQSPVLAAATAAPVATPQI